MSPKEANFNTFYCNFLFISFHLKVDPVVHCILNLVLIIIFICFYFALNKFGPKSIIVFYIYWFYDIGYLILKVQALSGTGARIFMSTCVHSYCLKTCLMHWGLGHALQLCKLSHSGVRSKKYKLIVLQYWSNDYLWLKLLWVWSIRARLLRFLRNNEKHLHLRKWVKFEREKFKHPLVINTYLLFKIKRLK